MAFRKSSRLSRIAAVTLAAALGSTAVATAQTGGTRTGGTAGGTGSEITYKKNGFIRTKETTTCQRTVTDERVPAEAQALAAQITTLITGMASGTPEPGVDDYEAAIIQVIIATTPDQAVQLAALDIVAAGTLTTAQRQAVERVREAARACRLNGTAALADGGADSQFSPLVDVGGGSVNYTN